MRSGDHQPGIEAQIAGDERDRRRRNDAADVISAPAECTPRASSRSIHSPDSRVSRPTTNRSGCAAAGMAHRSHQRAAQACDGFVVERVFSRLSANTVVQTVDGPSLITPRGLRPSDSPTRSSREPLRRLAPFRVGSLARSFARCCQSTLSTHSEALRPTPPHALSQAASSARSVPVGSLARSFARCCESTLSTHSEALRPTPPHALSQAASSARSVPVGSLARSFARCCRIHPVYSLRGASPHAPTRALASRFVGSLRSRGLTRALVRQVLSIHPVYSLRGASPHAPTRALASRFVGSLRSRGLTRALVRQVLR